jgi:hypothetical protein
MEYHYQLAGGAPIIKRYQAGATMATAGVPVTANPDTTGGLALATTTAAVLCVGVTVDTATLVTAQQSDGSDPERTVGVIVNPFAVFRARLSGGATANTALGTLTETLGDTTGLLVTFAAATNAMDNGSIWGYTGANAGYGRKNITGATTTAVPHVAFPADSAIGDTFIQLPFWYCSDHYVQLTTLLNQIDASVDTDTDNANFRVVDLKVRPSAQDGTTTSWADVIVADHMFNGYAA